MRKTISYPILNLFFLLITISIYPQQASEENNSILSKQIEENNKRLEILRTEDSLHKILKEQSGDIDIATQDAGERTLEQKYGGLDQVNQNTEEALNDAPPLQSDIHRSSISKLIDSIPSEFIYYFLGIVSILTIKFLFKKKG